MLLSIAIKKRIFRSIAKMAVGYKARIWLLRKCNYLIGENVFLGEDLIIIDDLDDIGPNLIIGDRVAIAPRVTLVLYTVPNWSRIVDFTGLKKGKIIIEKDAWIGTGVVVLPGVRVGEGAVVGANSVVRKDVSKYSIVGGVPAKEINKVKTLSATN
jgi:acetyltransferase-like isoleucine patch superfamily enzyme